MPGIRRRKLALVVAAALLLSLGVAGARVLLAGRPAADATAAQRTPDGEGRDPALGDDGQSAPPVIVPGRPGEPATVKRADQVGNPASPRYNSMDTWFVRMMIPHHTQALQMAALAPGRAGDDRVRALAGRIRASQAPEILQMRGWLDARGLDLDGDLPGGHDHGTMRGMQSTQALQRLAAARGADFDRLFVEMMIDHHQGAIDMAINLLRVGVDATVGELANSVATEQAVEITRMRELLTPVR